MSRESVCLKVRKIHGEKAIALSKKLGILDKELEIQRNATYIYIPSTRQPSKSESEKLEEHFPGCQILNYAFPERKKRRSLIELLEEKLPSHLLTVLPRAIDFVGDIGVIELPPELEPYESVIGEAILKMHEKIQTVLAKASAISGTYRLREFRIIAGEPRTDTIHKEYGCQYYVDLARAYFSPRLSYEHSRVASLVQNGETIVDLFAGVGPFAVPIAKTHESVSVYAIDANPDAVDFLKRNIRLNRVESKVHPILGDAKQVAAERVNGVADRVIMNLPENAIGFVDAACKAMKPAGGIVHFYCFVSAANSLENIRLRFTKAVEEQRRKVEKNLFSRLVRETAPYEWQAVLDAKIR